MANWRMAARALLGTEGRTMTAAQLEQFYAEKYLTQNPTLDQDDAPRKVAQIVEVCREAGVSRVGSLLEVGCGSGQLLTRMARALEPARVAGVDYSESVAAVARANTGYEITAADGARLPFDDARFDLVYFADVLEHVLDPVQFLRELGRVGKRVAFLVPLEAGLIANALYAFRRVRGKPTNYEQYGHIWRWFRRDAHALLAQAGLRLIHSRVYDQHSDPAWMNRLGRAVERVRGATTTASPRVSEALFGNVALVGIAERAGG